MNKIIKSKTYQIALKVISYVTIWGISLCEISFFLKRLEITDNSYGASLLALSMAISPLLLMLAAIEIIEVLYGEESL